MLSPGYSTARLKEEKSPSLVRINAAYIDQLLRTHLVHTVQELQEDGGEAAALAAQRLSSAVAEPVTERQPLLLHQQPETIQGSVVGVTQQLHQGHHLHTETSST